MMRKWSVKLVKITVLQRTAILFALVTGTATRPFHHSAMDANGRRNNKLPNNKQKMIKHLPLNLLVICPNLITFHSIIQWSALNRQSVGLKFIFKSTTLYRVVLLNKKFKSTTLILEFCQTKPTDYLKCNF